MREIKFRAWNESKILSWEWLEAMGLLSYLFHGGSYMVMQYIGLKDKDGKECYHKDIVMDELWHLWLIEWSEEDAGFELQPLTEGASDEGPMWIGVIKGMVIVGNEYENPELLSATK